MKILSNSLKSHGVGYYVYNAVYETSGNLSTKRLVYDYETSDTQIDPW